MKRKKLMKTIEIRKMAKGLGIMEAFNLETTELIWAIQKKEGFSQCYRTGKEKCDETICLWRKMCLKNVRS